MAFEDVDPNTRIDLAPDLFGPGSYIMLNEQVGSTSGPAPGQLVGGTHVADLTVNMIRVHISATDILNEQIDIIVGHATAHADFPQTELCSDRDAQAVSGHAFLVSERTNPSLLPVMVGLVEIPSTGGFATENLTKADFNPLELVSAKTGTTETFGSLTPNPNAHSYAAIEEVCILKGLTGGGACTVGATLLRTEANSSAVAGSSGSNIGDGDGDGDTTAVGLEILGDTYVVDPFLPSTITLPGLGFVIINEAFCGAGTLPDCAAGGDTAITVRSIHVVLTVADLIGVEVIVSESHSDAHAHAPAS